MAALYENNITIYIHIFKGYKFQSFHFLVIYVTGG